MKAYIKKVLIAPLIVIIFIMNCIILFYSFFLFPFQMIAALSGKLIEKLDK